VSYASSMELCISHLIGGIAAALGDREAIVTPERRLSWRLFDERATGVAASLCARGVSYTGLTVIAPDASVAERMRSPQPHFGILSGNCPEYLEAMVGIFRARAVPVNMNYRYTPDELAYVVKNAGLCGVVYQRRYGPGLAAALEKTGSLAVLVDIDDGSGIASVAGSVSFETLAGERQGHDELPVCSGDDRYLLYTGGTTGFPKGVLWRQEDWFRAALGGVQRQTLSCEEAVDHARSARHLVGMPASPMMHGAGHWSSFSVLLQGGTVVIPAFPDRLDPGAIWAAVEAERVVYLQVVGDAFLGPLLDEFDRHTYDLTSLRFLLTSGAIASPSRKQALHARLPGLRILDTMGSSESGTTAESRTVSRAESPGTGSEAERTAQTTQDQAEKPRFRLQSTARVLSLETLKECEIQEEGLLAQTGSVPLAYLDDPEKTAATFPVRDGMRYSIPGDHAVRLADGDIFLLGRGSQCINTGGEKVFPEEVEQALKNHPDVADALVAGVDDAKWGQAVGAVVELRPGREQGEQELRVFLREYLAGYKVPKFWVISHEQVARNQVGKPDYVWARRVLTAPS